MARIVINPGRPIGMVRAQCNNCGYDAFVDVDELQLNKGGSPFSAQHAFVRCGNPNCKAYIAISKSSIPDDVVWDK